LISSQHWKKQHAARLPAAAAMLGVATAAAAAVHGQSYQGHGCSITAQPALLQLSYVDGLL
jgi:hypothetical protein